MNVIQFPDIKMEGEGAFTPPPSPCGNPECGWVELDLNHSADCDYQEDEQ